MAQRNVFKLFGSIGPAGSLVSLTEKICSYAFPHAYAFGNEDDIESKIDVDLRKCREEYIKELFLYKNKFAKNVVKGEQEKEKAYEKLIELIHKYIEKTVRLEKSKYMRERIFYKNEGQQVLYNEANNNYHNCKEKQQDNLVK